MLDREKVLTWLEICGKDRNCSGTCPYSEHGFGEYGECKEQLMEDAFDLLKEDCHNCKLECLLQKYDELKEEYDALLKEQEPIEPYACEGDMKCGNGCEIVGYIRESDGKIERLANYCPYCGRPVKWD